MKYTRMFRLYCSLATLLVLGIILSSVVWFCSMENSIREKIYIENKRELSLLNYSINTTNENLRILSINTFYHDLCQDFLRAEDVQIPEGLDDILVDVLHNNPLIQKIELFNKKTGMLLSIGIDEVCQTTYIDAEQTALKGASLLEPVPAESDGGTPVFQYYMYDSVDKNSVTNGALIFSIQRTWLSEVLNSLNRPQSQLSVVSRTGKTISESADHVVESDTVLPLVLETSDPEGNVVTGKYADRLMISYLTIPNSGWLLVNIRPYWQEFDYLYAVIL